MHCIPPWCIVVCTSVRQVCYSSPHLWYTVTGWILFGEDVTTIENDFIYDVWETHVGNVFLKCENVNLTVNHGVNWHYRERTECCWLMYKMKGSDFRTWPDCRSSKRLVWKVDLTMSACPRQTRPVYLTTSLMDLQWSARANWPFEPCQTRTLVSTRTDWSLCKVRSISGGYQDDYWELE